VFVLYHHNTVLWRGNLFTLIFCWFSCFFVCLYICTVTDFSAADKARGVKFCMRVGLLFSEQDFSPFGERWLVGSHGGGGISRAGRHPTRRECFPTAATVAGHWELEAAA